MSASLEFLECAWMGNPFNSDAARTHSSYTGLNPSDGELVRLLEAAPIGSFGRIAHAGLRSFIQDETYPCLGAKAALARNTYRFGAYARMDDAEVTEGLARDLYAFVMERRGLRPAFTTFIAVFRERSIQDESGFETALWSQLQRLHDLDAVFHDWDPRVSKDVADPNFSFSFAGNAFFVVGLSPRSSRPGRRFAWPALVFNAHDQFDDLRRQGLFEQLKSRIRARDRQLSGAFNPMLNDFGAASEAHQYSGKSHGGQWRCPFRAKS